MNDERFERVTCGLVRCATADGSTELKEVVLAPDGKVPSKSGTFIVDAESGRLMEQAFAAHGNDLPIDYEHQTLGGEYARPDGKAPAAGWIKAVHYEPGKGLIGEVEWTDCGRGMIRAKEYRYLSPVTVVRKVDLKAIELHSVGLTNKPAIPGMESLAAKDTGKESTMEEPTAGGSPDLIIGQIAQKLGVSLEGKSEPIAMLQAILDAIPEKAKAPEGGEGEAAAEGGDEKAVASKALCHALGVGGDAGESELLVAIGTLKQTRETNASLTKRVDELTAHVAKENVDKLVQPFLEDGRINPNDEVDVKACREMALKDPAAFQHHVGRRQPNPPPGRTTAPPRGGAAGAKDRTTIIANAARTHADDPDLARLTGKAAWVGEVLRKEGLGVLTDEERKTLG